MNEKVVDYLNLAIENFQIAITRDDALLTEAILVNVRSTIDSYINVLARERSPINSNVVNQSKRATKTQRAAALKVLPKTGTMRKTIMDLVREHGGLTDSELEVLMKGKHQSISAARRSLVVDGWLKDSGKVKRNSAGNDCTIWITDEI